MRFDDYQKQSRKTAIYPNRGKNFIYPALGLAGEAGEVAGKVSKVLRDKGGVMDKATRDELKKELGDVLWFISQLATELKFPLASIADDNLKKLSSRKKRKVLGGSGDDR